MPLKRPKKLKKTIRVDATAISRQADERGRRAIVDIRTMAKAPGDTASSVGLFEAGAFEAGAFEAGMFDAGMFDAGMFEAGDDVREWGGRERVGSVRVRGSVSRCVGTPHRDVGVRIWDGTYFESSPMDDPRPVRACPIGWGPRRSAVQDRGRRFASQVRGR